MRSGRIGAAAYCTSGRVPLLRPSAQAAPPLRQPNPSKQRGEGAPTLAKLSHAFPPAVGALPGPGARGSMWSLKWLQLTESNDLPLARCRKLPGVTPRNPGGPVVCPKKKHFHNGRV